MSEENYGTLCCISGGGAPVIEHAIGIIKAIQTVNFARFTEMWGTSAGAIVSSTFMSIDQNVRQFEQYLKDNPMSHWFKLCPWQAIKSVFGLSNYVADNTGLKNFLCENITDEATKHVKVAVTDMGAWGEQPKVTETLFIPGSPKAVLASMSFQHIFPPVVWNGRMYQDGGINNLCPLPKYLDLAKYEHIYIILAASTPLFPTLRHWPFMNQLLNTIDKTMEREVAQIEELKLDEAPNITVFKPDAWVKSASFLDWSDNFEQIDASYEFGLQVLERKGCGI